MHKQCFGEYHAFNDNCENCYELNRYCQMWKSNMLNFRRKRNLAMFICFMLLVAWNFKIGLDLLKTEFNSFAILNFSVILLYFSALGSSIKSKKKAMQAYKVHLRRIRKSS